MERIFVGEPVQSSNVTGVPVGPQLAAGFEEAFTQELAFVFSYVDSAGNKTSRLVEAHGILVRSPLRYIIAWDIRKDAARLFRADRIKRRRVTGEIFTPRPYELVTGVCPDAKPWKVR